ncbi:MAG: CPBP family intramembrane metalloprotease [Acidimicrobiia bacterium]|nr:CPBP family intramembrane metalloprotease [Acidimicrobiia bacterium]
MVAQTRLEPNGTLEPTWLAAHPLAGSAVITVLTGLGLQLTHLVDFEERMSSVVGWTLWLQIIDFGFRNIFGVLVVLIILPYLFGHVRNRPWFVRYLRYMRLSSGSNPRLTAAATAASALILAALVIGLGMATGALKVGPAFWGEDSRWFILILALVPALWEELAFRGLMLTNLQRRYRPWMAVVLTGGFFGLMHFSNLVIREPQQVVAEVMMATAVGIAWGYVVAKTGSVVPAMVLHYFINVLIGLTLDPELDEAASAVVFGSVTIVYPVVTIIATWWLARSMGRHRPLAAPSEEPTRELSRSTS